MEKGQQSKQNSAKLVTGITSKRKQDDGERMAAGNKVAAIKEMQRESEKMIFDAGFFFSRIENPIKWFPVLSSEHCSQIFGTLMSASKVVPESRAKVIF